MLRSIRDIVDYTIIDINDEVVGKAHDFYFDDLTWTVRYLVVSTGVWLPGRRVLISPVAVSQPDWGGGVSLPVELKKEQIENSPPIDVDKPISRQQETELADYYNWPHYWKDVTFLDAHAVGMRPEAYLKSMEHAAAEDRGREAVVEKTIAAEQTGDPHLRSTNEVVNYNIHATDGEIGHVEDFIVDTGQWVIRYLVIDTKNWWPAKKVLISPLWVDKIEWEGAAVHVDLTREQIKKSPEYNPAAPVNREYETRLYDYYGRPKYWL